MPPSPPAVDELRDALADEPSLRRWLAARGYTPAATTFSPPRKKDLSGVVHYEAQALSRAPRLLVLWSGDMTERAIRGNHLRAIQREANHHRTFLRGQKEVALEAPDLFLLGCPEFLLLFPLDGDPFSRRMRFSPGRLPAGSLIEQRFREFSATSLAALAREASDGSDDPLAALVSFVQQSAALISWPWNEFFVGAQLDEGFVAFMSDERRRIARLMLQASNRDALLAPLWRCLRPDGGALPELPVLLNDKDLRASLIAAVDTVLLRQVLYRYLEVQFGYSAPAEDEKKLALGTSYDELLRSSVSNPAKLRELVRRTDKSHGAVVPTQTAMFGDEPVPSSPRQGSKKGKASGKPGDKASGKGAANASKKEPSGNPPSVPPPSVRNPEAFSTELRQRAERYQSVAGGDLHQGLIAEAADILQRFLLKHHGGELARLLAGTSTDEYSFHYADLDPRAFQDFYQRTIGTDIRIQYDPQHREPVVGVVEHEKNRKEQGAYYTDEKSCAWLVQRTLGVRLEAWARRLHQTIGERSADLRARVQGLLGELMDWKILDPTCGGGIFLRAAFELLSRHREQISDQLDRLSEQAREEVTSRAPFKVWHKNAEPGEWEWYVLLHMLHGVDVDVKAVNVASNLLTLSALSYKPNGLCFPSFVNVSLKQGNALITPLRPEQRATFLKNYQGELVSLLELRARLRDPNLPRHEWKTLHEQADLLSRSLVQAAAVLAYKKIFDEPSDEALLRRVMQVGLFCYEVEFPEVFFELVPRKARPSASKSVPSLDLNLDLSGEPSPAPREARLKPAPGFDFVLGNPPWEEPAAEYKHFLPDYDPGYRELKGPQAKQREAELLADPHIEARWESFQRSIADYKKLLTAGWYQHQRRQVQGRFPGAHTNLYKYATELGWTLLKPGGMAGLVTDGGLWSDLASSGLRALLLDQSKTHAVAGFTNNEGLFPDIHRSTKFALNVFERAETTETLRAVFMLRELEALDRFDALAMDLLVEPIRKDARDSYPVPEVRTGEQQVIEEALKQHPMLQDKAWDIDTYSRELNAGEQRDFFLPQPRKSYLPLIQGTQFNLFGVHQGQLPTEWLDPGRNGAGGFLRDKQEGRILEAIAAWLGEQGKLKGGKDAAARAWVRALTGSEELPEDWVKLDWDGYRLAWRDIARNDDKRTLICAVLPARVGVSHTAPFVRPFSIKVSKKGVAWALQYSHPALLYLAGLLSSFVIDSVVRTRLAKTHFTSAAFRALPVPVWKGASEQVRIAELTARLTCLPATTERPWADYTALAAVVGLEPARDGLTEEAARRDAIVELNALAAQQYGLGKKEFSYLMETLFMTPAHREEHERMKVSIVAKM